MNFNQALDIIFQENENQLLPVATQFTRNYDIIVIKKRNPVEMVNMARLSKCSNSLRMAHSDISRQEMRD
jgi:hypothetical protein